FTSVAGLVQRELIQLLAGGRGVFAGDARLAEVAGVQPNGACDGINGQIAQRVRAQGSRHLRLNIGVDLAALQEFGGEQLVDRRHVDAVKARRNDWRAGDADVDLL